MLGLVRRWGSIIRADTLSLSLDGWVIFVNTRLTLSKYTW